MAITNYPPTTGGGVSSVSGTAPVVSSGGTTPVISIPQATALIDGYLSSTDWSTFNNKGNGTVTSVAALTLGTTGTDLSSTVATGTTTPVITLNVPTASATNRGVLSSTDWSTFNAKGNGTVTSVSGTGTVSGLSLSGTVTNSGNLTLGGTLDLSSPPAIGGTTPNTGKFTSVTATQNIFNGYTNVTAAAGTTVLTATSTQWQKISGTTTQTFTLPDATTLPIGASFIFDNDSTGVVTINDNASSLVDTMAAGVLDYIFLENNSTAAGSWGKYCWIPAAYNFSTTIADFGGATATNGTLQYIPSYFYRKNTATTLSSATGNQSILGLTSGVTLVANTIYEVECEFELTTTGTTSHTESFGFTLATATVTNMGVTVNRLAANTTSSALGAYLTSVTPVVVTGALTTSQTVAYRVKGTIAIGTGGSVNPVIAFSAAPGGTSTIVLGAWAKFNPIGTTGSNVSIGTWA